MDDASSTFTWKGLEWVARGWAGPPAVNGSWAKENVRIDERGSLRLTTSCDADGRPVSAEVNSTSADFGHGTYRFVIGSRVDDLDEHVIVGLCTYDGADDGHEIDVEAAAWGRGTVAWDHTCFVVSGGRRLPLAVARTIAPPDRGSVHEFVWSPQRLRWRTWRSDGSLLRESCAPGAVPPEGRSGGRVVMNLWVSGGRGWEDAEPAELTVEDFSFQPWTSPG